MMAAIPDAIRPRLGQFVRLLGSDQPGEVVAAATALRRALAGVGADLHDLAGTIERPAVVVVERSEPAHQAWQRRKARVGDVELDFSRRAAVSAALRRALASDRLSEWEEGFAQSIVVQFQGGRGRLTERQGETLARLLGKIGEAAAWASV